MSWNKAPKEAEACKDFADRALQRIVELEAQLAEAQKDADRYRAALQDIVSDPITSEPLGMKRGVAEILAVARSGLDAAMEGEG